MRAYVESLQVPTSTMEDFEHFLQVSVKGKDDQNDPFRALLLAIYDDSESLIDVIRASLERIREDTLDEDLVQMRIAFWRALLHRFSSNLGELDKSLRSFVQFLNDSEMITSRAMLPSEKIVEATHVALHSCMDLIDKTSHSLFAELQVIHTRKSIAEAESVAKLTELAFVFIPLSFVASLFSMQVHELDGGVPLYQFALVAIGFVIVAYAIRLGTRSAYLIAYKDKMFSRVREDMELHHKARIPTHKFLYWLGLLLVAQSSKKGQRGKLSVSALLVLAMAALLAVLSPIVLLWVRKMDRGFTAAMTVLVLLLDAVLLGTITVQVFDDVSFFSEEQVIEAYRAHRERLKGRRTIKRKRRHKASEDPEHHGGGDRQ